MEKPRKFFHHEKRSEVVNGDKYTIGYLHAGRVQISVEAVVLLSIVLTIGLVVTQIVLGFVTGWNVWWPFLSIAAVLALGLVVTLLSWIVQFIMYFIGEITINGPYAGGKD